MNPEIYPQEALIVAERRGAFTVKNVEYAIASPALTNTDVGYSEYMSKKRSIDISFPHNFFEIRQRVYRKTVNELFSDSGNELTSWINGQILRAKKYTVNPILTQYVPTFVNVRPTPALIEKVVEVQINSNLDIVNVPDSDLLAPDKMYQITKSLATRIEHEGKKPFFSFSLASRHSMVRDKIAILSNLVSGVIAVGSAFSDVGDHLDNLYELANAGNSRNILRVLSGCDRTYPTDSVNSLYPLAFFFADVFSVKYGGFGNSTPDPEKERGSVKRFDPSSLSYFTIQQAREQLGNVVVCNCRMCKGMELEEIYAEFNNDLRGFLRLHEALSVFGFCEMARDMITNSNLSSLLKSKSHIASLIKDELFIKTKLDEFNKKT